MKIEAYSNDYDVGMDVANNGMSGKVFVSEDGSDTQYEVDNLDVAMKILCSSNDEAELTYCYKLGNEQMFKRFKIYCPVV